VIGGFSLVEQQARPGRLTEGMAWLTSALAVGTAAGSAAAGQVIDADGARWGYAFAAVAALACLAGLSWLTDSGPHPSPAARAEASPEPADRTGLPRKARCPETWLPATTQPRSAASSRRLSAHCRQAQPRTPGPLQAPTLANADPSAEPRLSRSRTQNGLICT